MINAVPNVLYLVWDDAGIATWNAFGGLIDAPYLKWLAGRGLRYSQWHTPARSEPTRGSLLTGRDGTAGRGARVAAGDPGPGGPNMISPPGSATLAEIMRRGGYRTYCVGKWDLGPAEAGAMTGSRRAWPLGRGFDRFYGFLGCRTSHWYPDLVFDNQNVDPAYSPAEGYHLTADLANMAMEFIRDGQQAAPAQPWLCYLSFGGGDPQAAPREWADAYRGRFEMGYDRYREAVLGNMKRLGVVPEGTTLAQADGHPSRGELAGGGSWPWPRRGTRWARRRSGSAATAPSPTPRSGPTPTIRSGGCSASWKSPGSWTTRSWWRARRGPRPAGPARAEGAGEAPSWPAGRVPTVTAWPAATACPPDGPGRSGRRTTWPGSTRTAAPPPAR